MTGAATAFGLPVRRKQRLRMPSGFGAALGTALIAGYLFGISWFFRRYSYDYTGAVVLGTLLLAFSLPVLNHLAASEPDARIRKLMMWGLVVKLLAAPVRYAVTSGLYGGVGDAHQYHVIGTELAPLFRHGTFVGWQGKVPGTGFIEILTGAIYSVTGATELGGYVVFSWFGFWGLYWFYRAFRLAIPDGNRVRYAALVFFLPSLVFWPSSIGKEAWLMLALGVSAYGTADLYARGMRALPVLLLGLGMVTIARPHITLLVVAAVAFGYLVRPHPGKTMLAPLAKGIGLAALLVLVIFALSQARQFFQADTATTGGGLSQALTTAQNRTSTGGSQFSASSATSLSSFPQAFMTVLYRPYVFEARSGQTLIASLDGTLLLVLTVTSWRQLRSIPSRLRRQPYLAFVLVYLVLFVIAFSHFANFGILARERVQVIPFLIVLLCLPSARRDHRRGTMARRTDFTQNRSESAVGAR